jgi:hypothetical protein
MIKLSTLIQENTVIADKKPVKEVISSTIVKDLFNENQVIKVENGFSTSGDHHSIDFHLSNGKIIKIEGVSDDDIIYVEIL